MKRPHVEDLAMLVTLRHGNVSAITLPRGQRIVKRLAKAGLVQSVGDGSIAAISNRGEAKLKELALSLYEEPVR